MYNTNYDSPHGLVNKNNYSTADDIAILISECMKLEKYRQVVGTKEMRVTVSNAKGDKRQYFWQNSNKLLGTGDQSEKYEGILGCKTGIT